MEPEKLIELRMRALEIAERSVHQPYISSSGGDSYRDKDDTEIKRRAQRFMDFVLEAPGETPKGLIDKLRDVLCEQKSASQ